MTESDELQRGTVLAGKYELSSILGMGGMGVVYRGRHLVTERPIAVKVLRRELVSNPTLAKRFVREAKAAAALQHPNVVDVLDYGVDPDGTAFQVLELLEGESLGEHLERKGTISIDVTLSLLLPVIHALAVAHARGVVHRDLKPDNVFLARNVHGRIVPKLLDFGVAKLMPTDGGAGSTLATRTGAAIGTPAYMSPEQARGTGDVGAQTDVWAIGVILFECVAGRPPFEAETGSIMMARIITEQAPSLASVAPDAPEAIVRAIDRALASKLDDRWPTMDAFAEALRGAASACGIAVPPPGASDTGPMSLPPPRREIVLGSSEDPLSSGDDVVHPATGAGATADGLGPTGAEAAPKFPRGAPTAATDPGELAPPAPTPAPARSMTPVLVVSLVLAAVLLLGTWMRNRRADASTPPAPVVVADPPRAPEPPVIVAPLVPAPSEAVLEDEAPPAAPAIAVAPEEEPAPSTREDSPSVPHGRSGTTGRPRRAGEELPELTEW